MTAFHSVSISSSIKLLLSIFFISSCNADRGTQPKIISSYQKEQWLSAGDTLRLICPVASDPAPIVTWKKDGDDIHIGWERFRIREDALQIRAAESGDSGIYVCSATNGFGTVSAQFAICVSGNDSLVTTPSVKDVTCNLNGNGELPSFVNMHKMKDRYIQLVEGDTTQLSCQAAGKPKPEIRWFKDGNELSSNYNSVGNNWLLTLSDVAVGDDGQYTCNVFNRVGSVNYTYVVKVTERQLSTQEFRLFVLKNVTASVGSTASFHCEVHSDIETHIQWLRQIYPIVDKQNANYTIVVGGRHFTVVQRGSTRVLSDGRYLSKLTIRSVGMNDSGVYVCSAANSNGFRLQSAFLKVVPSTETFDQEFSGDNSYSMSQFLPIVATITTMFLILIIGIVIYLVFQHCHPSGRCSSSSSASSASSASHHCSPSSASAYVVPQNGFNNGCVPLKYQQHPQQPQWTKKDCYKGAAPQVMECGCSVPLRTTTQHLAPACQQREHLLYSQQQMPQEDLQLHFYEHC